MTYYYYYYTFIILLPLTHNIFIRPSTTQVQGYCTPSGTKIPSRDAPRDQCDQSSADCCRAGQRYDTYTCSPQVTGSTSAILTLNSFERGGDGGGPSECDGQYHSDDTPVVALSTGWYSGGSRCGKQIVVNANWRKVRAKVVDECDSKAGCDAEHGYQRPCRPNIVDGSKAVWYGLGIHQGDPRFGETHVTWYDAGY